MKSGSTRIDFESPEGNKLSAQMDMPENGLIHSYVLFAHCFTCNKNYKAPVFIARYLANHGIATLRFDFSGIGSSSGDFSKTSLTSNVDDVLAAVDFMSREYGAPRALIGHSLGGAAMIRAANRVQSAELAVTIGTPSQPGKVGYRLGLAREQAMLQGVGILEINGRKVSLRKEFFEDLAKSGLEESVHNLDRKLLVVHSPEDKTVPFENAEELMEWARLPKSLLRLDGADHLISREEDAERVANAIAIRLPR